MENAICTLNQCSCNNGVGASGTECLTHGDAKCTSCDDGYHFPGLRCGEMNDDETNPLGPETYGLDNCVKLANYFNHLPSTKIATYPYDQCWNMTGIGDYLLTSNRNCRETTDGWYRIRFDSSYHLYQRQRCFDQGAPDIDIIHNGYNMRCDATKSGYDQLRINAGILPSTQGSTCVRNECTCEHGVAATGT